MALRHLTRLRLPATTCGFRQMSDSKKFVSLTIDDKSGISVLNLQRPPVNSLNLDLLSEINGALLEAEKQNVRGLILTSKKDGIFSAGLDIMEMYQPDPDRLRKFWSTLQDTWINLYGSSYPTAAVINGHSPAGGCLLALSCEYRVMTKNFTIGLNETQLGIVAPLWFVASMKNVIGQRQTEAALTTGRMFTTDEALSVGLVDNVVDNTEEGISKAHEFFGKFKKIPPKARSITKQYVRGTTIQDLVKTRIEDLEQFVGYALNPAVQKFLGSYMEMLKSKGSKKN